MRGAGPVSAAEADGAGDEPDGAGEPLLLVSVPLLFPQAATRMHRTTQESFGRRTVGRSYRSRGRSRGGFSRRTISPPSMARGSALRPRRDVGIASARQGGAGFQGPAGDALIPYPALSRSLNQICCLRTPLKAVSPAPIHLEIM